MSATPGPRPPINQRLDTRHTKTPQPFEKRHDHVPTAAERPDLTLIPSRTHNPNRRQPISHRHFNPHLKTYIADLKAQLAPYLTTPPPPP
ncbi:hypothetical protein [Streptomyces antioxidans]|uniref:hypothetical protein n=1 Tax=Streptomyces antioxidans TaxID=1507734 RepID=UPI000A948E8F|nr:hypothetical protein [Streptomyces antioxidans]